MRFKQGAVINDILRAFAMAFQQLKVNITLIGFKYIFAQTMIFHVVP